jgi:hypothetical protein
MVARGGRNSRPTGRRNAATAYAASAFVATAFVATAFVATAFVAAGRPGEGEAEHRSERT